MNIVFLHIPKTAGQSVHAYLERFFRKEEVCPARENFQLLPYSINQLRQFRLFSGHLDWALLDAVDGPRFAFTVLRQPTERILSFYFFLRRKAATFDATMLNRPEHQGLKAAISLTPDEYFCGGPPFLRHFLDTHYDNFYTYYFAGRTFDARNKLISLTNRTNSPTSEDTIVQIAIDNLRSLDAVYTTQSLDKLESDLQKRFEQKPRGKSLPDLRVNAGEGDYESRVAKLRAMGASQRTFERIGEMTRLDDKIWATFRD